MLRCAAVLVCSALLAFECSIDALSNYHSGPLWVVYMCRARARRLDSTASTSRLWAPAAGPKIPPARPEGLGRALHSRGSLKKILTGLKCVAGPAPEQPWLQPPETADQRRKTSLAASSTTTTELPQKLC